MMKKLVRHTRLLGACLLLMVGGCETMPVQGPTTQEVIADSGVGSKFFLVKLTPAILQELDNKKPQSLVEIFGDSQPAPVKTLQKGDVIAISIWDAGGGLFSPQGGAVAGAERTEIPNQAVDHDGNVSVPFVGQLQVAGKSTLAAQKAIVQALQRKALEPQALVTIVSDQSNLVTVVGDVKVPGRLVLDFNGTRILDAIARSGGSIAPAFDTLVQLTRRGLNRRVRLDWILRYPSENIYLQAGDVLYVLREPQTVAILGAAKTNARLQFDAEHLTLGEVIGESGGLVDIQAEPTGVFIFRPEPLELVRAFGDTRDWGDHVADVPVIFQVDLRKAEDYFLARDFKLEDRDIVYVADAETVQLNKVLATIFHAVEIFGVAHSGSVSVGP
jgi:polysaccharide biosynthesis/export protein